MIEGEAKGDPWGLEGKTALVTGAGAAGDGIGNGRAAAILLARAGARVLAVDRARAPAERTVETIAREGGEALAHEADVTCPTACRRMVEHALDAWGRVDCLDNNVGVDSRGSVVDEEPDEWRRVMRVNVESMFLVAKEVVPAMIRNGGGAIVNVASIAALRPRGMTSYAASKGAAIALTRAMAVDHGADGVRVNCVAPGPVYTPMVGGAAMSAAARERRRRASALGIEGTGWDVGRAVRFLLSAEARYITGHTLVVDGGATLLGRARASDDQPNDEE